MTGTAGKKQLKRLSPTPRVNSAEKPAESVPTVENDPEYRCSCCGHKYKKQRGNFNISKSPIYKGNNGYVTICRHCLAELFEQYTQFFDGDEDSAMERICQITDTCVDDTAWNASRRTQNKSRIGAYIARLNISKSSGQTYSDTLSRRWMEREEAERTRVAEKSNDIREQAELRFGKGFSDWDCEVMQAEYDSWIAKEGTPIDKRQEELYVTICYLKLSLQKAIQNDAAGIGAMANSYRAFIEAATTEIADRKKQAESERAANPIGVLIKEIEEYCPADFYKKKKLYADFDRLKEYIDRFLSRPLRNLLTGSKDLDQEFNLSDGD